jgi:hypothetical protein
MSTTFVRLFLPPINESGRLSRLFRLMCRYPAFTPARYDEAEPLRTAFDKTKVDEISQRLIPVNDVCWSGEGGLSSGAITLREGRGKQTASLVIWTDVENLPEPTHLTDLVQEAVALFGSPYGYLHYLSPPDVKKGNLSDTVVGAPPNPPMVTTNRWSLVRGLPDLYWANVFGPECVALFGGRDRVAAAPAPVVKELAPDTFYVQLSDTMQDFGTRYAELDRLRDRLKEYLGADCFDYDARFGRTYRTPSLGCQEPARPPLTAEALMKKLRR